MIITDFLESKIPIVVYVAPGGAQAGSAGVFITTAAHIAAMAPGTNIGAAHPVEMQGQMDSVMSKKVTNDAAAFIRSIAEKRHRNLVWAEEAVRESKSITETEALKNNVIDLISPNLDSLLSQIDGRIIVVQQDSVVLHTKYAHIETIEMGWGESLLNIFSDPNVAYILMMLGMFGLLFELYNPGLIFPGIVGVISLIIAFYSMHTLPINYAGLALIIFGVLLFVLEIKIVSHGLLAIGGVISFFFGSVMLIQTPSVLEFAEISWSVITITTFITAFFFVFLLGLGLKIQGRKPMNGKEGLIGEIGDAVTTLNPDGTVKVHGELWQASTSTEKIIKGESISVTGITNLKLQVERFKPTKE
jgi:membrane-bound serine protease (ClpP class)